MSKPPANYFVRKDETSIFLVQRTCLQTQAWNPVFLLCLPMKTWKLRFAKQQKRWIKWAKELQSRTHLFPCAKPTSLQHVSPRSMEPRSLQAIKTTPCELAWGCLYNPRAVAKPQDVAARQRHHRTSMPHTHHTNLSLAVLFLGLLRALQ